jgi:hypothetical protein
MFLTAIARLMFVAQHVLRQNSLSNVFREHCINVRARLIGARVMFRIGTIAVLVERVRSKMPRLILDGSNPSIETMHLR